ncbi:hypothetical protein ACIPF8_10865 [Collimonas sp. NPDC087041]|uniref:hypothetical protein n=1 Tax=Collimonas sp. NPDC087041 TaxID=3363960 RepID=UPI0037F951B6
MFIIKCQATGLRFSELFACSMSITTNPDQTMKFHSEDAALCRVNQLRVAYGSFDWAVVPL